MIHLLAISGSLRKASSNTALLRAAAALAPQNVGITVYDGLGDLPLFNPDLEGRESSAVLNFRSALKRADGVIIASPEYAHGITGTMKNALDWIVASGEIVNKPMALLNASLRSKHAYESLREIVKTMDGFIVNEASVTIPLPNDKIKQEEILKDSKLSQLLRQMIDKMAEVVQEGSRQSTVSFEI